MPIILLRMTSERHFFVALSFRGERREEGGGTNEKSGMLFYREITEIECLSCFGDFFVRFHIVCDRYTSDYDQITFSDTI